jgi:hypothetical protein
MEINIQLLNPNQNFFIFKLLQIVKQYCRSVKVKYDCFKSQETIPPGKRITWDKRAHKQLGLDLVGSTFEISISHVIISTYLRLNHTVVYLLTFPLNYLALHSLLTAHLVALSYSGTVNSELHVD